jgi:preprotein translocase SecE subunit
VLRPVARGTLTLGLRRSTYPPPAAGPRNADIRRGLNPPNNRARLLAHPSREGWANEGCSDSLDILKRSDDSKGLTKDPDPKTMAFSPFKFLQEVRAETAKVTWPTRRETTITTIMVFVMVALASVFFFAADQVIRYLVTLVLGIH